MGARTIINFTDGLCTISLYAHWMNAQRARRATAETFAQPRNNMTELRKFVVYFILDHEAEASFYLVPHNTEPDVTIDITEFNEQTLGELQEAEANEVGA